MNKGLHFDGKLSFQIADLRKRELPCRNHPGYAKTCKELYRICIRHRELRACMKCKVRHFPVQHLHYTEILDDDGIKTVLIKRAQEFQHAGKLFLPCERIHGDIDPDTAQMCCPQNLMERLAVKIFCVSTCTEF